MIRVAVAEDLLLVRRLIVQYLSREKDIEIVFECGSGSEILAYCLKNEVDAVIIDIGMSDMNGIDALIAIKKTKPTVASVLMTGDSNLSSVGQSVGADIFIDKGVSPKQMADAVRKACLLKKDKGEKRIKSAINVSAVGCVLGLNDIEIFILDKIVNNNMSNGDILELIPVEYSMTLSNVKRIISKIMNLAKIYPRNRQALYRFCFDFKNEG